jgi:hypothetical protein
MEIIMEKGFNQLCDYGCGKEACYQLKNGKWCCSKVWHKCRGFRQKMSDLNIGRNNPNYGKKRSIETKHKQSRALKGKSYEDLHGPVKARKLREKLSKIKKGKFVSEETKQKQSNALKGKTYVELFGIEKSNQLKKIRSFAKKGINHHLYLTMKRITKKYPFFSKIEEMRYNPDKPGEKEIQVHCKNHLCENSKEKGGWFTPTRIQLYERIRCLELHGADNSYFYCCQECKNMCPLYASKGGIICQKRLKLYTQEEYKQFRQFVLERDNNTCQYCGEKAEQVHHERPQKLEPFFALDPDYAWSVCKRCHYKYGHKDECSTGNLAVKIC